MGCKRPWRRIRSLAILGGVLVAGCQPIPESRPLAFSDLAGWESAEHRAALEVWCAAGGGDCAGPMASGVGCGPVPGCPGRRPGTSFSSDIEEVPDQVRDSAALEGKPRHPLAGGIDARQFWETRFRPVVLPGGEAALLTGYFEPVLAAARTRSERFQVPLYSPPPGLEGGGPQPTRAEIDAGALAGQGLEIFWLDDPVARFFLQVQGSGRLRLPGGETVRVGYAGKNGHAYVSIGKRLVERGAMAPGSVTADTLAAWLRADPARGAALMRENPSFVFFREITGLDPAQGPIGSVGRPLTPWVSVAVDPAIYPLGSVLWIDAEGPDGPIRRLTVAEDTGSAIKGPGRADLFHGTGDEAGRAAGALQHPARLVLLVPR